MAGDTVMRVERNSSSPLDEQAGYVEAKYLLPRELVTRLLRFMADGHTGSLQVDFVHGAAQAWKLTETGRIDTRKA